MSANQSRCKVSVLSDLWRNDDDDETAVKKFTIFKVQSKHQHNDSEKSEIKVKTHLNEKVSQIQTVSSE